MRKLKLPVTRNPTANRITRDIPRKASLYRLLTVLHLRFRRQLGQRVDLSPSGFLEGAVFLFAHQVERRDPEGEILLPRRRRLGLQLLYPVGQADEAPFHHVALRAQPGARLRVVLGRQVRRLRDGEQVVHRLVGAAEVVPRQRRVGDAQRAAERLHLPRAGHALALLVAAQREQADARPVRQLLLREAADEADLLQGIGEAPADPPLLGIGPHRVVLGVHVGEVRLAEVVVELVLPQLVVVAEGILVGAHRPVRLCPSAHALDEEAAHGDEVGALPVVAELEAVGVGELDSHEEQLVQAGEVVERGERLGHDLQRGCQPPQVLGLRRAPGELVVAHGGLVDAGYLGDLLLGEAALRPQLPQLLRQAVLLSFPRQERVLHVHRASSCARMRAELRGIGNTSAF